jgi:hypothetical protein
MPVDRSARELQAAQGRITVELTLHSFGKLRCPIERNIHCSQEKEMDDDFAGFHSMSEHHIVLSWLCIKEPDAQHSQPAKTFGAQGDHGDSESLRRLVLDELKSRRL